MESGTAPARPATATEPGRRTSYLLILCAAVLTMFYLAAALNLAVDSESSARFWILVQSPGLATAVAIAGAITSSAGAGWARRKERSSGTTLRSIGYGIGSGVIAAAVFSVMFWASVDPRISGTAALIVFVATVGGGVVGSVRIGGAIPGGLVAATIALTLTFFGGVIRGFTASVSDVSSLNNAVQSNLVVGQATTVITAAVLSTVIGCWWLTRRRLDTGLLHLSLVGLTGPVLTLFALVPAGIAIITVYSGNADSGAALSSFTSLHGASVVLSMVAGILTSGLYWAVSRVSRRRTQLEPQLSRPGIS